LNAMIDHQTNKEMILIDEVSDEAVEAAGLAALGGLPTLPHTYCFACPADPPSAQENNDLRFQVAVQRRPLTTNSFG
jgi:hypothetical protein